MKFSTALVISVIAHIGLVAFLVFNFQFAKIEIKSTGVAQPKINAKAVDAKRVEQLVEQLKKQKQEKKRKEQKRLDDIKKAEQEAQKKRREEEKKAAEAIERKQRAERKRKAEEKKAEELKQKRILDEKKRQQKLAEEKKRKEEAERKQKQAEEERKRKAKQEAERQKKLAEEKARQQEIEREMQAQMDAQAAELEAAHQQQINSEVAKYATLIQGKVTRNWIEPEQSGYCVFKLSVAQGGLVIGVTVVEGNPQHCESGQRAIYKSEPLPVSKDPDVFEVLKSINLTLGEIPNNE